VPGPDDVNPPDGSRTEPVDANPLRWIRSPIPWARYEVVNTRPSALRILFVQAGGFGQPGAAIAEVNIVESRERVEVELVEREFSGHDREQEAVPGCLEIQLDAPVGQREVFDTAAGVPRPALTDPPAPGYFHHEAIAGPVRDCPRWDR
jgi:hypothetical protein